MSDYEGHKGYLIPTDLVAKDMIMEKSGEDYVLPLYSTIEEEFCWMFDDYFLYDGIVYKRELERYDEPDRYDVEVLSDGRIKVDAYFYNGGTGLEEIIEEGLDEIKKLEVKND